LVTYFFDSSALAKRYHSEDGTARVLAIFEEPDCRIVNSHLSVVEMRSMFAGKMRMGVLTIAEAQILAEYFKAEIAKGLLGVYAVTGLHYQQAEGLIARYGFDHRLRTLDALQLAFVLDLRQQGVDVTLVTADRTLYEVAILEGVKAEDPTKLGR
jgi:predicted nucleic acid-binding protein